MVTVYQGVGNSTYFLNSGLEINLSQEDKDELILNSEEYKELLLKYNNLENYIRLNKDENDFLREKWQEEEKQNTIYRGFLSWLVNSTKDDNIKKKLTLIGIKKDSKD